MNQSFKPAPALVTRLSVNFILFFLLIMSFTVFPVLFATGPEPLVLIILAIIVLVPIVVFVALSRTVLQEHVVRAPQGRNELEAGCLVPDNRRTAV